MVDKKYNLQWNKNRELIIYLVVTPLIRWGHDLNLQSSNHEPDEERGTSQMRGLKFKTPYMLSRSNLSHMTCLMWLPEIAVNSTVIKKIEELSWRIFTDKQVDILFTTDTYLGFELSNIENKIS